MKERASHPSVSFIFIRGGGTHVKSEEAFNNRFSMQGGEQPMKLNVQRWKIVAADPMVEWRHDLQLTTLR